MFAELPSSPQAFYSDLLVQSIAALKLNTFLDNFDAQRFIKDKYPFYSCYVDHYTIHAEETVLYCRA